MSITVKKNKNRVAPNSGDIWMVDFSNAIGSQQGGRRPAVIWSNAKRNEFSSTVKCIPLSSKIGKKSPVHVYVESNELNGLKTNSVVLCENEWVIDKSQLLYKMGRMDDEKLPEIASAIIFDQPLLMLAITPMFLNPELMKVDKCVRH